MKIYKKRSSGAGEIHIAFSTNKRELEILKGVVSNTFNHTPKIPATEEYRGRLQNMRHTFTKAFDNWDQIPDEEIKSNIRVVRAVFETLDKMNFKNKIHFQKVAHELCEQNEILYSDLIIYSKEKYL